MSKVLQGSDQKFYISSTVNVHKSMKNRLAHSEFYKNASQKRYLHSKLLKNSARIINTCGYQVQIHVRAQRYKN
jgi:hypothetical protein